MLQLLKGSEMYRSCKTISYCERNVSLLRRTIAARAECEVIAVVDAGDLEVQAGFLSGQSLLLIGPFRNPPRLKPHALILPICCFLEAMLQSMLTF